MADPKLKSSSVRIQYASDDGYKLDVDYTNRGPKKAEPHKMLLAGIKENARILALFGFEAEAREAVDSAFQGVAEWRAARNAQGGQRHEPK